MTKIIIKDGTIINEGGRFEASLLIENGVIKKLYTGNIPEQDILHAEIINAKNKFVIPGVIDDHVHFREPGFTHKGDMTTESHAAVAGGVTSVMEMPNTNPKTVTLEDIDAKLELASSKMVCNFSFYLGATNSNIDEIKNADASKICGVKLFMGSSTGNMLVDRRESLERLFAESPLIIAIHSEDEAIVQQQTKIYKEKYGDDIPNEYHPLIRSEEACYRATALAVELAQKRCRTRIHLLHLSTARELSLFRNDIPVEFKKITAEACIHHLWFNDSAYKTWGSKIKVNPAIKSEENRIELIQGLINGKIDVMATDHAPHTLDEKNNNYVKSPSGTPLIQFSLQAAIDLGKQNNISIEQLVEKMCHNPAQIFNIDRRGYIRENYWADLVIIDANKPYKVVPNNILSKCGWSVFEGETFSSSITHTIVNGNIVFKNNTVLDDKKGMSLKFNTITSTH